MRFVAFLSSLSLVALLAACSIFTRPLFAQDIDVPERSDFLKMDIESGEQYALVGMKKGLEKKIYQRILLELHVEQLKQRNIDPKEVIHCLFENNYKAWIIKQDLRTRKKIAYSKIHLLQ